MWSLGTALMSGSTNFILFHSQEGVSFSQTMIDAGCMKLDLMFVESLRQAVSSVLRLGLGLG